MMIKLYNTNSWRMVKALLTSTLLLVLLAACGTADNGTDEGLEADAFVAAVNVTDDYAYFIGILVAPHPPEQVRKDIVVYLCDNADVSTWFFGQTTSGSVALENDNIHVQLSLGEESVSGTVERRDLAPQQFPQYSFEAQRAVGDAGLYRAEETIDGQDYVGGWVVLNNLEQQGAITLGGQVIENPTLDVTTGQAETSVGTFSTVRCFRNPFTGERICRAF
jgi:hypothetical protein